MKAIKYYNILLLLLISGCMDVEHEYELVYSNNPWYENENGLSYIASDTVDLGLPSGIKWASYNVGASKPEDCGGYYAWGETETKREYTWETYKWCNGSKNTMTKYCIDSSYGTVDNKTVLEPEDDVAHVKWGGSWRMPTDAEQQELIDECTWVWTTLNGVKGYKVTGPNGKSIFFPAAGNRSGTDVSYRGTDGDYWSSSLRSYGINYFAYHLNFSSSEPDCSGSYRYFGRTVRPVMGESKIEPKEKVDLGLPSGIKWATCNVGAYAPEKFGGYYAWGETETKSEYTWETYKWCNGSEYTMTKYCTNSSYGAVDNKTVLEPEDDVAHVKWGGSWRMPTDAEQQELIDECTWVWTTLNGIRGYMVTGPNGKSIFLPAAGNSLGTSVYGRGTDGYYWLSSLSSSLLGDIAYYLKLSSSKYGWNYNNRCYGLTVRPVSE